ncbi:hypothetical protein [Kitasatospora kifunensis]|uniref:Uncharacterized protein n=1 Tax=Kitasatospora kifunensis TaxID=58351 RepID=A0A7W7QZH8_KITKI|nr:hypothetical protein [Kitasatospora kifunensis]MBB4921986.1 hypothetical protein [Kitasatospora kifunensis]
MAAVVFVHGIAKQYLGPQTMHGGIAAAAADGVRLAGGPPLAAEDVAVAFYGHAFRARGGKGEAWHDPDGVTELELDLLLEMWRAAARLEPAEVPAPADGRTGLKARVPLTVQHALHAVCRSRFLAGVGEQFLLGTLSQLRRYLSDRALRERVQAEVAAVVTPDTRVLIGHSLGSVVAYEALCAHPEWGIQALVTLGSPLGIPRVVLDRVRPEPVGGRLAWPGGVRTWTNICDRYDVVALTKELAPLVADGQVRDLLVDNGWQAHAVEHHLTAMETGQAVAEALRGRERE